MTFLLTERAPKAFPLSLIVDREGLLVNTGVPSGNPARPVPEPLPPGVPRSLFDGVDAAVCAVLGVARLTIANLKHRSALHDLGRLEQVPPGSVAAALDTIASNWERCARAGLGSASRENWRWCEPQTYINKEKNRSAEVVLERAIVTAFHAAHREDWANQVPVASGVVRSSAERRRAIDLVHERGDGHYEFIELKIASDTPLYAAFEIISYVGVWLLSRNDECGKPLLEARRIDARVLAPAAYYAPFSLGRIEQILNQELRDYGARYGTALSFGFEVLPDGFEPLPGYENADVIQLIDGRRPL